MNEVKLLRTIHMVAQAKIVVTAGDLEIDVSGATVEVDARLIQMRHDDTWSIVLERVKDARDAAIEAAIDAAKEHLLESMLVQTHEITGYLCGVCAFLCGAIALLPLINARAKLAFNEANSVKLVQDESE